MAFQDEIKRRRTFAIISHPDAGKTTLTEKFLLYGGAIQTAGAVKSNKIKKSATSDFMEIERQRGISVATSVMTFEYNNVLINLLDTPGHKDFAEDTYRTLTAVDSAIIVIDCVKGVEERTEKLMEVCRMRNTPVIIFINKLDRVGKDPFDLLDELEAKLMISVRPLSWPINMGADFKGVYNLYDNTLDLFRPGSPKVEKDILSITDLNDEALDREVGTDDACKLREDIELIEGVYDKFDADAYLKGELAPVFFGSAINNFGVSELLETFVNIAPAPRPREAAERIVFPEEEKFSGFVFKIHANIDPRHRDRIAFLRICSGKFERNKFFHHVRLQKDFRFSSPATFMAQEKNIIDEAYPGDVIGLYDTGNFKIGDTLTEGEHLQFKGIPSFSPEIFREVFNTDPMKSKQLDKGIHQLTEEGVAQLFVRDHGNKQVIGTVGELQFDVIQYRLLHEYKASCVFKPMNLYKACWITSEDEAKLKEFCRLKSEYIYKDKDDHLVFMAESAWMLNIMMEDWQEIKFHFNSEFKTEAMV
ncbi:MAG TPA: peptide chain release factor 3 [Chitinophagales bacterium]|nr:peptide chain release factor 3 [Chitinophagales bacterium]